MDQRNHGLGVGMSTEPLGGRFAGDVFPDATWGLCRAHNPVGIVRLVDDDGQPAAGGVCLECWKESRDESTVSCPVHGFQPKGPDGGCSIWVKGPGGELVPCVGDCSRPTEAEIVREAESYHRVWISGNQTQQNDVDAEAARPASVGDREAGATAPSEPREIPRSDPPGSNDEPAGGSEVLGEWRDPFLEP